MLKLSNVHALHLQKQMGYVHFASLEPQPSSMPTVPRNTAFMAASTSGRNQLQQAGTTLSLSILSGTPRYKLFFPVCLDCALYQGYAFARLFNQARLGTRSFHKTGR